MQSWSQLVRHTTIALLFGAVVTLGVTLLIVCHYPRPTSKLEFWSPSSRVRGEIRQSRWKTQVSAYRSYDPGTVPAPIKNIQKIRDFVVLDPALNREVDSGHIPSWALVPDGVRYRYCASTIAYGWPFRAMRRSRAPEPGGCYLKRYESRSVDLSLLGLNADTCIPTRVLWRGLAANSAINGSPLFLVFISRNHLRSRRRRRGHCSMCNYDLNHNHDAGCPECGWNRCPPA